ncbi:hypothetical protein MRX96_001558 [Rhipicephalus microplus]
MKLMWGMTVSAKVRLQRQLVTEVSGLAEANWADTADMGPPSQHRWPDTESGTSTMSQHRHQMKTIGRRNVSGKVRLQRQLVMKVSGEQINWAKLAYAGPPSQYC